jgi:hypothetical protein
MNDLVSSKQLKLDSKMQENNGLEDEIANFEANIKIEKEQITQIDSIIKTLQENHSAYTKNKE